jgi:GT2 family glycosyltransferase
VLNILPNVAIIIINWDGWKDTLECLESLYQITYPNYTVIIVDNGSIDDSLGKIRSYCAGNIPINSAFVEYESKTKPIKLFEYSRTETETEKRRIEEIQNLPADKKIVLIKNEKNYGFAEGNNIGIRFALTKFNPGYILLLNNDTVVEKHFLDHLVKKAQCNEKIGFCGPKVYYYDFDGRNNVINFAGGRINMLLAISSHIGEDTVDKGQYDRSSSVDWVEGSCMLVRAQAIKDIGTMDAEYFAYWEEVDWCLRGKKKGWLSWYVPEAKIWHKIGKSTQKINHLRLYYSKRNRILLMRKNAKNEHFLVFVVYFFSVVFFKEIGMLLLKKDSKSLKCFLKSTIDGFFY